MYVHLSNQFANETFYPCGGINDSVVVYMPDMAVNNINWLDPSFNTIGQGDSIVITYATQGQWLFSSTEIGKYVTITFISAPPYQPVNLAHDTSFCTSTINWELDAQNANTGATYVWDDGSILQYRTITTIGTYWVRIINDCGQRTDTIHITQANPNAPQLGPDQTFCWGSNTVLNPGSTNVTSYHWSTGVTTPTITVDTTGTYWVYVIDNNGCSGRDTINITSLMPIDEQICYVEFDTVTWKNNVNWPSNLPGNADSVRIYKEDGVNWVPIGTVYKTTNHFLDMASNPQAQSYSYKIAVIDTCGNESNLSSYHKTITLLSAYDQPSNTYGFTWSRYEGLVVTYYYLYGIDASNNVHLIATVNGSVQMYNYVGPNPAYIKYYVGFETPDCDGTKANVIVKSNWITKDPLITGIQQAERIPFNVYPNPVNTLLHIDVDAINFTVELRTTLGQVILAESNAKTLDVSNLSKGVYFLRIIIDGTPNEKKIVIN